jgi:hypothetical protein
MELPNNAGLKGGPEINQNVLATNQIDVRKRRINSQRLSREDYAVTQFMFNAIEISIE